jgi:rhodanese-related sulfurtransferase
MPDQIDRHGVMSLRGDGAVLIEVLSRKQYENAHVPGAINIPLKDLDRARTAALPRDRPVIVYCHDHQ